MVTKERAAHTKFGLRRFRNDALNPRPDETVQRGRSTNHCEPALIDWF